MARATPTENQISSTHECPADAHAWPGSPLRKDHVMWYFAWILGVGFAVLLAIMNAMWGENEAARAAAGSHALGDPDQP